ncbi:hypothetical protein ACKUUI_06005 [Mycobacterium seoulense]|uniref:hypothetical protein n=1 Tax=Mycobacterium seoulense TaxID=386911 RepID=UPI003CEBB50A
MYLTIAVYAHGWGGNRNRMSSGLGGSEDEAMRHAVELVDQMRRDGANSTVRHVRVRRWEVGSLANAPAVFEASYYDPKQGLTDAEAYAARVHDWHAQADSWNRWAEANHSKYGMGYGNWMDVWGPQPVECPACGADLGRRVHRTHVAV